MTNRADEYLLKLAAANPDVDSETLLKAIFPDNAPTIDELLTQIAVKNLLLDEAGTLEVRGRDSLDFHDCSVLSIKDALTEAFTLGVKKGLEAGEDNG